MSSYASWYETTYPFLTGHGLWLRGGELNTLSVSEYDKRPFKILITRLSTYFDTAESFSHKVLYQIARRQGLFPDFAFLPPVNDAPVFLRDDVPWLMGIGTKRGPRDFDLIAFSNSIVQELVNVPLMLENSGIPPAKSARLTDPSVPLVILGGSNALHTSVFFTPEPPVDGIFFGESTECIADIFKTCADGKKKGLSKSETLERLEKIPGFIQPDKPKKTKRHIQTATDLNSLLIDAPVFNLEGQYGTGNLQISEGCPCFCSFCSESYVRKPYREVPADDIIKDAGRMKAGMGLDKVELYSFNFNMHSGFGRILGGLADIFPAIGLKSQRFDMLAAQPGMLPLLHAAGKTSLTCGLEGISPRLRRYLHKSLSEADLEKSLVSILSSKMRELKIFLLITGKEEKQDFTDFEALLRFIKEHAAKAAHAPRIIFSATPLVRFPWTPLEFEDATGPDALKPVIAAVRTAVEKHGFEFRMSSDVCDYHLSQILARVSDPGTYDALLSAIRDTGYVYYRSVPASFVKSFIDRCGALGIRPESLTAGSSRGDDDKPWLTFETGVDRAFLVKQHGAALTFVDKGYCLGTVGYDGKCLACGVCDDKSRTLMTAQCHKSTLQASVLSEKMKLWQSSKKEISFLVHLNDRCRGLPRQSAGAALARTLMITEPDLAGCYAGFGGSFWSKGNSSCWITGDDIITLLWIGRGVELLENGLPHPARLSRINKVLGDWGTIKNIVDEKPSSWSLSIRSPFPFEPKVWFAEKGLPYMLRKTGDGAYVFDFSEKALKKKIVKSLDHKMLMDGMTELRMTVFDKFDPEEFIKETFGSKNENDWVRIRVESKAGKKKLDS
ncbi:MAG TPA: radical SAM protein [Chitinivibrionales bacterium]|nr:radical SAM protein [Chitinivibrionales bacterium]